MVMVQSDADYGTERTAQDLARRAEACHFHAGTLRLHGYSADAAKYESWADAWFLAAERTRHGKPCNAFHDAARAIELKPPIWLLPN